MMKHYRRPYKGGKGKTSSKGDSDDESDDEYKKDDRMYHVGSVNHVADYAKTTAFHLTKLQRALTESKEIIRALRDLTECDLNSLRPVLKTTSTAATADLQAAEIKQSEFEYKAELRAYLILKRIYVSNKDKAYAHLWMHCTDEMQSKVKSQASEASATQQSVTTPPAPTGAASTTSSGTGMVNLQVTGWAHVQFASQPKMELYHSKIAGVCVPQPQDSSYIAGVDMEEEDLVQINQLDADTIAELEADEALYYGYLWDADAVADLETEETQHGQDSSFAGVCAPQPKVDLVNSKTAGVCAPQPKEVDREEADEKDQVQINVDHDENISDDGYQLDADTIAELEAKEAQYSSFAGVERSGKEAVDSSSEDSNTTGVENYKEMKTNEPVEYSVETINIIANDAESPAVKVESIVLMATIEVKEELEVCTVIIPIAFPQIKRQLQKVLEGQGFTVDPCDPCVANRVGIGNNQSASVEQKVNNPRSYAEAVLVSFEDNQSSMTLEQNGKASSDKRHFNIKYFYITILVKNGKMTIEYCPTDAMLADYVTELLTRAKFVMSRKLIMNQPGASIVHRSVLENTSLGHPDDWNLVSGKSATEIFAMNDWMQHAGRWAAEPPDDVSAA